MAETKREAYLEAVEKVLALLPSEAVRIHGDALRNRRFLQVGFCHAPQDAISAMIHNGFGFGLTLSGHGPAMWFSVQGKLKQVDTFTVGHGWKRVQRFALQRICRRFRNRIARRKEARALRVVGDPYLPPDLLNIAVEYVGSDEVAATPAMVQTCFSPTVSANRTLSLSTTH